MQSTNPIKLKKNGFDYIPQKCFDIRPPFCLYSVGANILINKGEKPIYFARKKAKGSMNLKTGKIKLVPLDIKYKIGKINLKGVEESYWISDKGEIIKKEKK